MILTGIVYMQIILIKDLKTIKKRVNITHQRGDKMNNSELESILKNESLDVLQKIYDYMAEELSLISEQDKVCLEKINNEMEEKFKILKQKFKILDESKNNNIQKSYQNIFVQEII